MDDLGAAIQGFLAQPGAMEQVEAMAKQLGLGAPGAETAAEPEAEASVPASAGMPELQKVLGGLGEIPPEALGTLMRALQEGGTSSQSAALLEALRPLLRQEKQEKLDRAIRAVRLMHTAKTVSKTIEL